MLVSVSFSVSVSSTSSSSSSSVIINIIVDRMDILTATRQMQDHKEHLERLKSIRPCIDSSVPKSLGLKHLASRPKKQQLIDDRNATVAKENKKLMERMTAIMVSTRSQPEHVKPQSRTFSKLQVDRINFENKLLLTRLQSVPPVLDKEKMERDFARHLKIGAHLRRRQIKPLGDHGDKHKSNEKLGGSFDNQSYMSQQGSIIAGIGGMGGSIDGYGGESPITSMQEFRKHVISSKKMSQNTFVPTNRSSTNNNNTTRTNGGSSTLEYTHNPI